MLFYHCRYYVPYVCICSFRRVSSFSHRPCIRLFSTDDNEEGTPVPGTDHKTSDVIYFMDRPHFPLLCHVIPPLVQSSLEVTMCFHESKIGWLLLLCDFWNSRRFFLVDPSSHLLLIFLLFQPLPSGHSSTNVVTHRLFWLVWLVSSLPPLLLFRLISLLIFCRSSPEPLTNRFVPLLSSVLLRARWLNPLIFRSPSRVRFLVLTTLTTRGSPRKNGPPCIPYFSTFTVLRLFVCTDL